MDKKITPVLLPLFLPMVLWGCSGEDSAPPEAPPPAVIVDDIRSDAVDIRLEFVGRTKAVARVELRARVTGFLEQRNFDEGSEITASDVLFRIEPDLYQSKVDQSKAQIEADKARLAETTVQVERLEPLVKSQNVSKQDYDAAVADMQMAEASLKGSEAALTQAELDLSYVNITSPVSGRISETTVDPGNLVGPDTGVLATVLAMDPMQVHFSVSDVEYLEFRKRQREAQAQGSTQERPFEIHMRLSDGEDYEHVGTFELIGNEVDSGTGTITIRASFPNPELLLRPGQFVTVILQGQRENPSLLVPQTAVITTQGDYSVLVVGSDNVVEQRPVKLGQRTEQSYVIIEGLSEGERVIVEGLQKARPGQPVAPSTSSGADAGSSAGAAAGSEAEADTGTDASADSGTQASDG